MQHLSNAGGIEHMEVDHFDPRKKKDFWQKYENLYLAKRACNLKKLANWPTPREEAQGVRFLDPCKETEYGVHIFEDARTGRVWGCTPAGRYHVRMLGLNSRQLVQERKDRALLSEHLEAIPMVLKRESDDVLLQTLASLKEQLKKAIPPIKLSPEPDPV